MKGNKIDTSKIEKFIPDKLKPTNEQEEETSDYVPEEYDDDEEENQ